MLSFFKKRFHVIDCHLISLASLPVVIRMKHISLCKSKLFAWENLKKLEVSEGRGGLSGGDQILSHFSSI